MNALTGLPVIETRDLTHRYGRTLALDKVNLEVTPGSLYALVGPNGAGKTTLLKILLGLLKPTRGDFMLLGKDVRRLTHVDRQSVSYVAEGQSLPKWMTLRRLLAYLAPLYPTWDSQLVEQLLSRFALSPDQRIGRMSRGGQMKTALLCALAPRPKLLVMDEPFTGMDALVKDELVKGLLELAGSQEWAVLLCSHEIGELESLADTVGFLDRGRLILSEPMDLTRARFRHVEIMLAGGPFVSPAQLPPDWLGVQRSGKRITFVIGDHGGPSWKGDVEERFPNAARIEVQPASLRQVFLALAREGLGSDELTEVRA